MRDNYVQRGDEGWVALWLIGVIVVVALLVIIFSAVGPGSSRDTINVTGNASVNVVPNTVSFQIGENTSASSAKTALAENNTHMAALEVALAAGGVKNSEMQSSGITIYSSTNNAGKITSFNVSDSLNVTLHGLRGLGKILDAASNAAGNGVSLGGVTFSVSGNSATQAKVRAEAIANARANANALASAAGVSVTGVVKIIDQGSSSTGPIEPFGDALSATSSSVPVKVGVTAVTDSVTVVYSLSN